MIMTQGNTCTYINGLTNINKWRHYFELRLKGITLNKKILKKNKDYIFPITMRGGMSSLVKHLTILIVLLKKQQQLYENIYSIQKVTCSIT